MATLPLPSTRHSLSARGSAALRGAAPLPASAAPRPAACRGATPLRVVAGNASESGPFSPLVVLLRSAVGVKPFNNFRGKAISLHSQVRGAAWDRRAPAGAARTRVGARKRRP